jgi:hypothetical protein
MYNWHVTQKLRLNLLHLPQNYTSNPKSIIETYRNISIKNISKTSNTKKHPSSNSMEINTKKDLQVNMYSIRKFFFIRNLRHACIWGIILLSAWVIFASSAVATAAMSRRRHLLFVLNIFTVRGTQDYFY